ncbi:MAG: histidine phosphatase family protein [Chthoniobacter sp.]|uniref:histidine phosphatase family protein n=1 Tax=Chthoniobacter sp. TaxID=2510640 RepID=UPI0032A4AE37
MPLHVCLIRHGETAWSISGQHTGRTDLPLTTHGKEEARTLGPRLRDICFTRVLTSPLHRARQTCELAGFDSVAEIEPDLAEWNYGDYEGRLSAEIRKQRPIWTVLADGCPGGEMPAQVSARADRLIARLREMDGHIALFSHGQFGCVLAARWIGLPLIEARHFVIGTASLSILEYESSHPEVPVIALWNSSAHQLSDANPSAHLGDTRPMKQRALERWENEGGEIPAQLQNKDAVLNRIP